jgi:hypothetical protein
MIGDILAYTGSISLLFWGAAHLFPTQKVVADFGAISDDNRRTITMEWITEGVALVFIGVLVALVTYFDRHSPAARIVYWTSFAVLNALSMVSLFTGFWNRLLPFKLCPFIFTGTSVAIAASCFLY